MRQVDEFFFVKQLSLEPSRHSIFFCSIFLQTLNTQESLTSGKTKKINLIFNSVVLLDDYFILSNFDFCCLFLCDSVFFLYCFIDKRRFSRIHLTWRFVFWVFSPLLRYLSQKKKKQISLHSHYSEKFPHSAMTLRQEFFIQFIPYVKLFDL